MTLRHALLGSDDPAWTSVLSSVHHDLYHLPSYAAVVAHRMGEGTPMAFTAEEDGRVFFVPLIVRPVPEAVDRGEGWFDATGPQGYPGPLIAASTGAVDDAFTERAIAALRSALCDRRIVAAFIRLHPLLTPDTAALGRAGTVVDHGDSVSIDLTRSKDELWRQTRQNHRRDIGRARRLGYVARIDASWARFDEFVGLYALTMDRLGARESWRHPPSYFAELRDALGERLHLAVVERGDELAAGALLTDVDGIVEYYLSGIHPAHLGASPTKLLIDEVRWWARDRGARVFHLAGSLRKDDPLIHFKLGFSPRRHRVASWRLIADDVGYRRLVERWSGGGPPSEEGRSDPTGFFPAYRSPAEPVTSPR